jgi:putative membrane protein
MNSKTYHKILLVVVAIFYAWTLYEATDYFTWCLEIFPAVLGLILILVTYRRFPLSNLSYTLIAIHAMILAYGGAYTYAKTPFGFWLSDIFGWSRNNYDKIGHFMQGFGPAIWGREILIRLSPLKNSRWLNWTVIAYILAFAAIYEFIEWGISLISGEAGDAFLGTQGYIWDTQSDMLFALIGSIVALLLLTKIHDKYLEEN